MSEAFSIVLYLKSKLFIYFVHVNQQGTLKTAHRKHFYGCPWNWGQHDPFISTCWTLRGNNGTVPAVHSGSAASQP